MVCEFVVEGITTEESISENNRVKRTDHAINGARKPVRFSAGTNTSLQWVFEADEIFVTMSRSNSTMCIENLNRPLNYQ